ncbi:MAG: phage head morphogenesis protein, partial [Pisciglobus halotolerans]|nr:phage head morphogenesis protein [Pisciglobus halotolerans]
MSEYWQRRNKEMEHIRSTINSDAEYSKALKDIYVQSERNVSKEIDSFLMNYAGREQISMDEARKRVAKFDVEAYKSKAKKYVEEKNFSPRANEELRLYNVKMKMNRLQLLN